MRQQLGVAPLNPPDAIRLGDAAAPTAKVGLLAITGIAKTWMPSDSAPALDLTIAPTWSAKHSFSQGIALAVPTSGASLTVAGTSILNAVQMNGSSSVGFVGAGTEVGYSGTYSYLMGYNRTSLTGIPVWIRGSSVVMTYQNPNTIGLTLGTDGSIYTGNATGAAKGVGTINAAGVFVNGVALANTALAAPTGQVGLTAVAGVASTAMPSDAAPALNQGIAPTWSAQHTWNVASGAAISVTSGNTSLQALTATSFSMNFAGAGSGLYVGNTGAGNGIYGYSTGAGNAIYAGTSYGSAANAIAVMVNGTSSASAGLSISAPYGSNAITVASGGSALQALGINGNAPVAKIAGNGTPTGQTRFSSFGGTSATLAQCSAAIAQIITDLKTFGLYGA